MKMKIQSLKVFCKGDKTHSYSAYFLIKEVGK